MASATTSPAHALLDFRDRLPAPPSSRVAALQEAGADAFAQAGFPGRGEEAWRFTSLKKLAAAPWVYDPTPRAGAAPTHLSLIGEGPHRLVFVDGRHRPDLSSFKTEDGGVQCLPLAQAVDHDAVRTRLGTAASLDRHRFAALNQAFLADGAVVWVPRGHAFPQPIHLLFLTTAGTTPRFVPARVLIVLEEGAQASVVEEYAAEPGTETFTCATSEVFLGANAVLDHTRVQHDSEAAAQLGVLAATLERDAAYTSHALALGGGLSRLDLDVALAGEGASCTLNGLYLATGTQHMDHHTYIDHVRPHTSSRQLYKGVLDGQATAVFNGRVLVREDSQKIETAQANNNLLLSERALVNTNPELEIFADDVKAQHGATIGQIEDEQLFYLRSRGIDENAARHLLIQAFAGEMIDRLSSMPLSNALHTYLERRF